MTTSPGLLPRRSKPRARRFVHCSNVRGVRCWLVSFESIHMGVSEGDFPCGNKYSSKLHFGMSIAGKGEEKGIAAASRIVGGLRWYQQADATTTTEKKVRESSGSEDKCNHCENGSYSE